MATIKEMAERLKISSATVSMALNDRPGVNPETRRRVMELAEELGYAKNISRRSSALDGMIGFVVYKRHGKVVADTQFFSELIEAIEHSARILGYGISIHYCQGDDALRDVLDKWQSSPPDAALLLATEMRDAFLLEPLKIPTMLLDCNMLDFDSDKVLIDNEEGIRKALHYLYDRGHREIGYFHSTYSIRNFRERSQAYHATMAELGLTVRKEYLYPCPPSTEEALDAVCEMLSQGRGLPSACIADNDVIACGALKAIRKSGFSIPEDVSLIGFDDVPIASFVEPELTSIHVSREALGGLAVKQLIRRIEKPSAPYIKIRISTRLVERNSVRSV